MVVIFSERGGKWKNVVVLNYSKVMYAMTVSLVMPTVQMIPAEETELLDQYMIIELEPIVKSEADVQETDF